MTHLSACSFEIVTGRYPEPQSQGPFSPEKVIRVVEQVTGIALSKMMAKNRFRKNVDARHLLMYLLYFSCRKSTEDIGRLLNRHHTTIMYGRDQVMYKWQANNMGHLITQAEQMLRA